MAKAWWFPALLEKPHHSHELVRMPTAVHEQRANALRIFAQLQAANPKAARPSHAFPDDSQPLLALVPDLVGVSPADASAQPPAQATQSSDQRRSAVGVPSWLDCRKAFVA